jgi:hypothetical protein
MDKIEKYRQTIQSLLTKYSEISGSSNDVKSQVIFDTVRDHYQLVHVGWHNQRREYGCVLHLDIIEGKIWVQHNGTELEIGKELVGLGVAKNDIILAFHSPYQRQFTDFAVS